VTVFKVNGLSSAKSFSTCGQFLKSFFGDVNDHLIQACSWCGGGGCGVFTSKS